jgi:shikimate kinase / 3-dehydroquinate synthase
VREVVGELLERHGLPVRIEPALDVAEVLAAIERDKKRGAEGVGFVFLERPGEVRVDQRVDASSLRAAVSELMGER